MPRERARKRVKEFLRTEPPTPLPDLFHRNLDESSSIILILVSGETGPLTSKQDASQGPEDGQGRPVDINEVGEVSLLATHTCGRECTKQILGRVQHRMLMRNYFIVARIGGALNLSAKTVQVMAKGNCSVKPTAVGCGPSNSREAYHRLVQGQVPFARGDSAVGRCRGRGSCTQRELEDSSTKSRDDVSLLRRRHETCRWE